jgi:hypothetical protein
MDITPVVAFLPDVFCEMQISFNAAWISLSRGNTTVPSCGFNVPFTRTRENPA